jgi:hypothetical protein
VRGLYSRSACGSQPSKALDPMRVARMIAEELQRLLPQDVEPLGGFRGWMGGACAALLGLLFVAVSLRVEAISRADEL